MTKQTLRENRDGSGQYHQSPDFSDDCGECTKVLLLWVLSAGVLVVFAIHAIL